MTSTDNFKGLGIPVKLKPDQQNPDTNNFHVIVETLTRMGVASKADKKLVQTCHCFHKRGEYRIMHFKEMFMFDGKEDQTNLTEEDILRRNAIVHKLYEWGLIEVDESAVENHSYDFLTIIRNSEKKEWNLVQKYSMGKK